MKNFSPEPASNINTKVVARAPQTIRLLPPEIIHRIAAGEIVDRPASVLKELIENSVDAKSTSIHVTLVEGGIKLIKVEDNGTGMSPKDLEVCLQRHATSKIMQLEDLDKIVSLGFRGEALAATSSVSRLTIESKTANSSQSFRIDSIGSSSKTEPQIGTRTNQGTTLTVADLFFNVPARLKFLKKASSELAECLEVFKSVALSNSSIDFSILWIDSKGEIKGAEHYPIQSIEERFCQVSQLKGVESWNEEFLNPAPGVLSLNLRVFPPPQVAHQQKAVRLSVNGRWVMDKRLPFAAREAFLGLIEVGSFPKIWVDVLVAPEKVDVNIHPQKKEIRWPSDFSLAGTVYKKLRELIAQKTRVQQSRPFEMDTQMRLPTNFETPTDNSPLLGQAPLNSNFTVGKTLETKTFSFENTPSSDFQTQAPFSFESLRVIGEVGASWLICESHLGLVIIDQHAAHERVEFDRYMKDSRLLRTVPLALPLVLNLPIALQGEQAQIESTLKNLGFEFAEQRSQSDTQIEILAMPECDRKLNWKKLFDDIFQSISQGEKAESVLYQLKVQVASSLACHGSVRRGQRLSADEIKNLLKQMSQVAWGAFCPHGRPVWKLIRHIDIENFFHR